MPVLKMYNIHEIRPPFVSNYARKLYTLWLETHRSVHFQEFINEIIQKDFCATLYVDEWGTVSLIFDTDADQVHFQMVWG